LLYLLRLGNLKQTHYLILLASLLDCFALVESSRVYYHKIFLNPIQLEIYKNYCLKFV